MSHRQQSKPKHNGHGYTPPAPSLRRVIIPSEAELKRMGSKDQQAALGIAMNCAACGKPATVRVTMYASPSDAIAKWPELCAVLIARSDDGVLPTWQTTKGPMVPFSVVGSCDSCRKNLETEAAKAPSWVHAEIYAPQDAPVQVAVPGERGL